MVVSQAQEAQLLHPPRRELTEVPALTSLPAPDTDRNSEIPESPQNDYSIRSFPNSLSWTLCYSPRNVPASKKTKHKHKTKQKNTK